MNEDQSVEWEEVWRDEYLRWICCFANAEGFGKAESPEEPLSFRILRLLHGATLGKAALATALGKPRGPGDLNAAVRRLRAEKLVAYTLPERPTSRLQAYRITAKGKARLAEQG